MHVTRLIAGILIVAATVFSENTTGNSEQPVTLPSDSSATPAAAAVPLQTVSDSTQAVVAPVSPAPTPATEKPAIVEESEEDLILDGGEESLLPSAQQVKSSGTPVSIDSQKTSEPVTASTDTTSDSLKSDSTATHTVVQQEAPVSPITPPTVQTTPTQIEKTQSINFARNFKEYRNPKTAILLSFLFPGAGQAYAHNYLKTAIFGTVEASMITLGVILNYQGNQKWKNAKKYANAHYTLDKFNDYRIKLTGHVADTETLAQIFNDTTGAEFIAHAEKKDQDYYNSIRDNNSPYVQGWDDVTPEFDDDFNIITGNGSDEYFFDEDNPYLVYRITDGDTSELSRFGFSKNQDTYNDKLSDANSDYRWSQRVFTMLLLNHIASMIDAGITAKAYNDQLLGKKTAWQRIHIHDTYVRTSKGSAQGLALEVRF